MLLETCMVVAMCTAEMERPIDEPINMSALKKDCVEELLTEATR